MPDYLNAIKTIVTHWGEGEAIEHNVDNLLRQARASRGLHTRDEIVLIWEDSATRAAEAFFYTSNALHIYRTRHMALQGVSL